ncbi:hypothetical protein GA0070560_12353 [Micromonospora halophytica]|uniref:Uncharacterized protein n=1 Tax=Micromonospora halophytica TaxID=47864 RepID=A0A1C5J862_9ACTN|nr:hypothetical protein GA0070560_12353 [Micromonospora halophytica]
MWLARAKLLARSAESKALETSLRPDSLYKGEVGPALLLCELDSPDPVTMPLYDSEGWPA